MVMKAYARASATPTADSGAAYVSVMVHGGADRLVAVSTPAAKMAGLHKTENIDGVMKMEHVDAIEVPANGHAADEARRLSHHADGPQRAA